ncbi:MAG: DUF4292 domain-containing protein [Saprospiraceae bacterium]|nr:DUF4292 domain-containing protein [Saprospiraceae bacterium]
MANISKKISCPSFVGILLLLLFISFLPSCSSKKKLARSLSGTDVQSIILKSTSTPDYQWMSGKAKVLIDDGVSNQKINMYVRINRDSLIWMAFKKLSVEGGRALVTADSVYAILRLEKSYYKASMEELTQSDSEVDFRYLQDVLAGFPPKLDPDNITVKNLKSKIQIKMDTFGVESTLEYDVASGLLTGGYFENENDFSCEWNYGNYQLLADSIEVPFFRFYKLQLSEQESLTLRLEFSNIEIDVAKSIRFEIPSHYTRLSQLSFP